MTYMSASMYAGRLPLDCHQLLMEADITFGTAARESMALISSSPGVLYNIAGVFRTGPVRGKIMPGFNLDTRKPLAANLKSTTPAIYSPKLPSKVRRRRPSG